MALINCRACGWNFDNERYVEGRCPNCGTHNRPPEVDLEPVVPAPVPDELLEANVIKRGENVVLISFRRGATDSDGRPVASTGLTMSVRVHPAVEAFMRSLGNGTKRGVDAYGKEWVPLKSEGPVEIWNMQGPVVVQPGFRLDNPGDKLMDEHGAINLSFLRIAGISQGTGVMFGIKGVYSLDRLRKIRDDVATASQGLYKEYIKQSDLMVVVSTQEVP